MTFSLPKDKHREGWQKSPYMAAVRRSLEDAIEDAHQALVAKCRVSEDPKIREAFGRWQEIVALKHAFEEEQEDDGEEED